MYTVNPPKQEAHASLDAEGLRHPFRRTAKALRTYVVSVRRKYSEVVAPGFWLACKFLQPGCMY